VLERYRGEQIVNVPNLVTVARIVGGAREAWRYHRTGGLARLWSSGAYFSFDLVDGWLARRLNQTTQAGGDLDKVGDKLTGGLLLAAGLRHRTADRYVVASVAVVNGSNVAATAVALARGSTPSSVPDVNRTSQALMNYGLGFNMIGNHLRRDWSRREGRAAGHVLRLGGGAAALAGSLVFGSAATVQLWRTVLSDSRGSPGSPDGTASPDDTAPAGSTG
jgi:phosphatidylglycerophosphate synthase